MASQLDQLNDLIQGMVAEKTLTLDGLAGIQKLKDMVAHLEEKTEKQEQQLKARDITITSLEGQVSVLRNERDALREAEKKMAERESKVFDLEKTAAVATATSGAYRDAMAIVFAPNAVRERVLAYGGQGMPNGQYTSNNEDSETMTTQGYKTPRTPGHIETDKSGNNLSL